MLNTSARVWEFIDALQYAPNPKCCREELLEIHLIKNSSPRYADREVDNLTNTRHRVSEDVTRVKTGRSKTGKTEEISRASDNLSCKCRVPITMPLQSSLGRSKRDARGGRKTSQAAHLFTLVSSIHGGYYTMYNCGIYLHFSTSDVID